MGERERHGSLSTFWRFTNRIIIIIIIIITGRRDGDSIAALDEAVLIDSRPIEQVVGSQLRRAEVRPARRRIVNLVHVDGDAVVDARAVIQTLLDALGVLVLRRSGRLLILVFLPLVTDARLACRQILHCLFLIRVFRLH